MPEMKYYDPTETLRGIQQVLVSDKKKIAFLFGAGTSTARRNEDVPNIPGVAVMTDMIVEKISMDITYGSVLDAIKVELENSALDFNVETLLTNVEDKIRIIGDGTLNGIDKDGFCELSKQIRDNIREIVSIHKTMTPEQQRQLIQYEFARWVRNADRKYAVEIFTTNYDYLFELGLEAMDVPYYDGFTGGHMPFFNAESLEDWTFLPKQTKLWKIHGSLGLHEIATESKRKVIRKGSDSDDLLIYPSSLKYSNSKKLPYAAFMDRLNGFLKQNDAVLFVCGYSFGDEHINERIISALNTDSTSHVFVLAFDLVKDSKIAQIALNNRRISVLSKRNAVVGSAYGTWRLKRKPDDGATLAAQGFFKEDALATGDDLAADEQQENTTWTGKGELTLSDFARFVDFLKNMIPRNEWEDDANE